MGDVLKPSDASMKLAIKKGKKAVAASCRIVPQAGTFVAEAISENPIRAIELLEMKMRIQLHSWKSHRFGRIRDTNQYAV